MAAFGGCTVSFNLNNGPFTQHIDAGQPGAFAGATADSCNVSGSRCSSNASANASGDLAWQVIATADSNAQNGATSGSTANAEAIGGISAIAGASSNALTVDSIANAKANSSNLFGATAVSGAQADAMSPGYAGASASSITIGGAALSSSTSNNSIDPSGLDGAGDPIKGFALSKSQGCTVAGSCGSALAVSSANNGNGFAGTITNSYAIKGDTVGSAADAQSSGELASTPVQVSTSVENTASGWSAGFTVNSGSSTAGTSVVLNP
jgi:hypothetical protein